MRNAVLVLTLATGLGGEPMPDGGYDLRYVDQEARLAEQLGRSVVRVEARHRLPQPFDPDHPLVHDGAATVVGAGRLLTTAEYLEGAESVQIVRRDGSKVAATVSRLDGAADLALLSVPEGALPGAVVVAVAPVPMPLPGAGASEVVMVAALVGDMAGLRRGAAKVEPDALVLSGAVANGFPAFDSQGRLVAVARRPTPDRTRTVAIGGEQIADWLGGD